jgi:hypothetical protein
MTESVIIIKTILLLEPFRNKTSFIPFSRTIKLPCFEDPLGIITLMPGREMEPETMFHSSEEPEIPIP